MFYRFDEQVKEIRVSEISDEGLYAGFISSEELTKYQELFGFGENTVEDCRTAGKSFRSNVEVYPEYTFTELRIFDPTYPEMDDCLALFIKKNLFLVVNVLDEDDSTAHTLERALRRFQPKTMTLEKLIYSFIDELISGDVNDLEMLGDAISEMEERVLQEESEDLDREILDLKKKLQRMHNLYEQYLDILETLDADENGLFQEEHLLYITNLDKRITRFREDADTQSSYLDHLQDAYFSRLDMKMNQTMKHLTVLTTIFFPLTIIVGWYGMNFQSMPEFLWKYGYLYVILLSVAVVLLLLWIAKKKKWF